ncbi:MAG: ribosomal protein S18-alanine N-acetyltransferase [Firmicutes bacterium]|nr:ribosomal protein S18-alanine N-acetyltransferase [Bacillota bacterium]
MAWVYETAGATIGRPKETNGTEQSMADFAIRRGELSDLDDVYALEQANSLRRYSRKIMNELFENGMVFVAEVGESLAGYVAVNVVFEDAELINIVVDKEYRERGIGGALFNTAIDESTNMGAKRILLEVESTNLPALRLYKRFGFVQISVREKYYGENDAMIMELVFSAKCSVLDAQ